MPAAGLPRDASYPAVLKPVDGAGSVDTYLVAHAGDIPSAALAMPVALLQPFHAGIPMSASFLVSRRTCLADRDRPSENRDPGRSIRVSRGPDTRAMRARPNGAQTSRRIGGRPARVRRCRFSLGTRDRKGHGAGDQSACHNVVRGAEPALACRPPGRGLAGGLRCSGIRERPAGDTLPTACAGNPRSASMPTARSGRLAGEAVTS